MSLLLLGVIFPALASDPSSEQQIEPGIYYRNDKFPEVPWSIHIIKIERSRPEFGFVTTKANDTVLGLGTLTDQIKLVPPDSGTPKVAINGDFYKTERERYPGDPRGLLIIRGELVSAPIDRACLWIDPAGQPQMGNVISQFKVTWPNGESIPMGLNEDPNANLTSSTLFTPRLGRSTGTSNRIDLILERDGDTPWLPLHIDETYTARVRELKYGGNAILATNTMVLTVTTQVMTRLSNIEPGAVLKISTATNPDLKGVRTAIGGGPSLLRGGKIVPLKKSDKPSVGYAERSLFERHPRSAVAWNDKYFFFIEVDGRQKNLSVGMTLAELSDYMLKLGCTDALNLDGGGSSTIWLNGKVMNSPCFGYLRNTATAFVLVRKEKP
jgi:hypothetical protein